MKAKTVLKAVATVAIAGAALAALAGCGGAADAKIAVPSDPTNEARALLLLQDQGLIKLKDGTGLEATKNDIAENPYNIEIVEMEAASLPTTLPDVDLAVINGNYAISGGIDTASALAREDVSSEAAEKYANVVAVRAGDENSDKIQALVKALRSATARQYIEDTYAGLVVPLDATGATEIEDAKGDDTTISVGASPAPHAEILAQVKDILKNHGYTLEVKEFTDYIQPNVALADGSLDANYFQHITYLEDYNAKNGTDLVSAGTIHFEPLGLYPGKAASIEDLKK
ncbi:MAG: MetQ/NlpA family ABC transporter substrate-binding protein [Gordonibacter sp.]